MVKAFSQIPDGKAQCGNQQSFDIAIPVKVETTATAKCKNGKPTA